MARRPDVLCAGGCGKLMFRGAGSLIPGKATCRACRAARPKRPRPGHDAVCLVCAKPFRSVRKSSGTWTQTCSRACGMDHRYGAGRTRQRSRAGERLCEVCGREYTPSYGEQRTCSRACGTKINRYNQRGSAKKVWPSFLIHLYQCTQCGAWFTARHKRGTCSPACEREVNRLRSLAYNKTRPGYKGRAAAPCLTCGEGSYPYPRRNCASCKRKIISQRKRRDKRRRRALTLGVATEPYTLAQIAERDHHRCALCHKRVAMTQVVPHPKAPTIDHLLPLACGGDDTRANVALAHFSCNVYKQDRGGNEQLALIG